MKSFTLFEGKYFQCLTSPTEFPMKCHAAIYCKVILFKYKRISAMREYKLSRIIFDRYCTPLDHIVEHQSLYNKSLELSEKNLCQYMCHMPKLKVHQRS